MSGDEVAAYSRTVRHAVIIVRLVVAAAAVMLMLDSFGGIALPSPDGNGLTVQHLRLATLSVMPLLIGLGTILWSMQSLLDGSTRMAPRGLLLVGLFCFLLGLPMLVLGAKV
jgi:hypothetical protein